MENSGTFKYSYSAAANREIEAIRKKYLPKAENKMEELKRLDKSVQTAGLAQSLAVGILSCIIFGMGMCMAMDVPGGGMVFGVLTGMLGVAGIIASYPIYRAISNKKRYELTPKILRLADELTEK